MKATFETGLLPQEIQYQVADNGEIGSTVTLAGSMVIFSKSNI
jgi:hypothetical protein